MTVHPISVLASTHAMYAEAVSSLEVPQTVQLPPGGFPIFNPRKVMARSVKGRMVMLSRLTGFVPPNLWDSFLITRGTISFFCASAVAKRSRCAPVRMRVRGDMEVARVSLRVLNCFLERVASTL